MPDCRTVRLQRWRRRPALATCRVTLVGDSVTECTAPAISTHWPSSAPVRSVGRATDLAPAEGSELH